MEHRSDADMGPEVLRIGRDREKGVGCCSKQDAIDDRLVLISDIGNLLWQRKYHMEIWDRKQIGFTCGKPFARRCALALRAVSITAANGGLTITCLMGKFRNGESTIDSVVKLTVFPVIPSRSISALLSITTVDRRDRRSARSCS